MSDPTRTPEIEDVLSSVRRLVSEGPEPRMQSSGDKLVLTPALRISDDAATDDQVAPEDGEPPAPEDPQIQPGPEASGGTPHEGGQPSAPSPEQEDTKDEGEGSGELENTVAELETAVADQDDQWEPDGNIGDDYAGHPVAPLAWGPPEEEEDQPPHDDAPDSDTTAEEVTVTAAGEGPSDSDEAVIDEDALRDLVADIVRQELQGALGKRITRNVRKLVRREISRVLTERETQ